MYCTDMVLKIWRVYAFTPETLMLLVSIYCKQLPLFTSIGNSRLAVAFQDQATATFCVVMYQFQTNGNLLMQHLNRSVSVYFIHQVIRFPDFFPPTVAK